MNDIPCKFVPWKDLEGIVSQAELRRKTNKKVQEDENSNARLIRTRILAPDHHTLTEFDIHYSLRHENIVQLYRSEEDTNSDLLLFYEYADCGTVHNFLCDVRNKNKFSLKLNWMVQCANALAYMHGLNPKVLHNDLSTRHLLICNDFKTIKIFDFSKATNDFIEESRDIYKFGILLWETLIKKNHNQGDVDVVDSNLESEKTIDAVIKLCCGYLHNSPRMAVIANILESLYQKRLKDEPNVRITDLELGESLGSGNFGQVFKATWEMENGNLEIAVKRIQDTSNLVVIEREVKYLRLLNHENIVRLFGVTKDHEIRTIIAMEYADCGSLHNCLHMGNKSISYMAKLNWMLQCAKGVAHLHKQQPIIMHRDLKPRNLLLFNQYRTLKICDFGTARSLASLTDKMTGTVAYMAPEIFLGKQYTEKFDVYSFGILCWEIMTQRIPFDHLGNDVLYTIIKRASDGDRPPINDIEDETGNIKAMVLKCWDKDPHVRPTMKELVAVLSIDPNSYAGSSAMIKLLPDISIEDITDQIPN